MYGVWLGANCKCLNHVKGNSNERQNRNTHTKQQLHRQLTKVEHICNKNKGAVCEVNRRFLWAKHETWDEHEKILARNIHRKTHDVKESRHRIMKRKNCTHGNTPILVKKWLFVKIVSYRRCVVLSTHTLFFVAHMTTLCVCVHMAPYCMELSTLLWLLFLHLLGSSYILVNFFFLLVSHTWIALTLSSRNGIVFTSVVCFIHRSLVARREETREHKQPTAFKNEKLLAFLMKLLRIDMKHFFALLLLLLLHNFGWRDIAVSTNKMSTNPATVFRIIG